MVRNRLEVCDCTCPHTTSISSTGKLKFVIGESFVHMTESRGGLTGKTKLLIWSPVWIRIYMYTSRVFVWQRLDAGR
jgi:hypothetical protein